MTKRRKSLLIIIGLILFTLATRLPYVIHGTIPFSFDHGKDSLAILDMVLNFSPKLIGPWTSIPGLYFGPGWYYLLAPGYLLSGYSPLSAVFVMITLVVLQVYLAYRYFGWLPAVMIAGAPFWLIISTSAWNPFPMTLMTLGILIVLQQIKKEKKLIPWYAFLLGLLASFGFHFSAAYAIFYPLAILIILAYLRPKTSSRALLAGSAGLVIPFIPQLLFELRHNFVQTKAVISYFTVGESHSFNAGKIRHVLETTSGELRLGYLPEFRLLPPSWNRILSQVLTLGLLGVVLLKLRDKTVKLQTFRYELLLMLAFIIVPVIGFFFLHFNVWYVYAMIPVMVLFVAKILEYAPKWFQILFAVLLLASPVVTLIDYYQTDRANKMTSRAFLPIKQEAIRIIRERAGDEPFASYQYVSDIYDFPYQYLYLTQGLEGKAVPTEFSYKPNAPTYVVQKASIMQNLEQPTAAPTQIFYIVENPENEDFLAGWWGDQEYSEIVDEIAVSDEVTIYVATP